MMKIALATLGCKVNQYESAALSEKLRSGGYRIVPFSDGAEAYIINTCTVTARTDSQSRQLIRRAQRMNPGAKIIVTGCYAQVAAPEILKLSGSISIIGNAEKDDILNVVRLVSADRRLVSVGDIRDCRLISGMTAGSLPGRTRAFLKIQDGCDAFCTYCIVPYARGRSRSLPEEAVLAEVGRLRAAGAREIVLSGIHLGTYGRDLDPATGLADLLRKIEERTDLPRLRLSSIEPQEITPALMDHLRRSRILCRHLHIPLQSADDSVLKRMGRHYGSAEFRALVGTLLEAVPDLAIGIDVMAGFPGEDEQEFANTLEFIRQLPAAYLHVFPYSARPGTPAARLTGQVTAEVKKMRVELLRNLGAEKRRAFSQRFLGSRLSVLVEAKPDRATGFMKGFSDHYIPTLIANGSRSLANEIVEVVAEESLDGKLLARRVDHE